MEGKILAAVSEPDSAEYVGLYSIKLAKRTGMEACVLMITKESDRGNGLYEKARKIQAAGDEEGVKVECLFTDGEFEDEVASHIMRLGSSILVVGDGSDIESRRKGLRKIEEGLIKSGGWPRNHLHQFLIVSKKGETGAPRVEAQMSKTKKIGGVH